MKNFWNNLSDPFYCLAPMADVTDVSFRQMFAKYGKPDVMWTEFVSADGFFSKGRHAFEHDLWYEENERPIVAQFFSAKPEMMKKAGRLAGELGFDGIDINMGCPDRSICKQGAGCGLIRTPEKAKEIIRATKKGAGDLPVTVKTRIGYNKNEIETWLPALLEEEPEVVIIHARTRKEMSKVPAQWEVIKRAVEIRDELKPKIKIVGNGDVEDLHQAQRLAIETGADGVMIGRGLFGAPWFFANKDLFRGRSKLGPQEKALPDLSDEEKIDIMIEHTRLYDQVLGVKKPFYPMRKHFKAYVNGFPGAKDLRVRLMEAEDAESLIAILEEVKKQGLDDLI